MTDLCSQFFLLPFVLLKLSDIIEYSIILGVGEGWPYVHRLVLFMLSIIIDTQFLCNCVLKPSKYSITYKNKKGPTQTHFKIKLLRNYYFNITSEFLSNYDSAHCKFLRLKMGVFIMTMIIFPKY